MKVAKPMISTHEHEGAGASQAANRGQRVRTPVELQDAHLEAVFAFVSRRIQSREDAEDVTSETFAAAFRNFHKVRGDTRLWLYGIARRKIADLVRKKVRSSEKLSDGVATGEDQHEALERKEAA